MRALTAVLVLVGLVIVPGASARSVSGAFRIPAPDGQEVAVGFDSGFGTIHVEIEDDVTHREAEYSAKALVAGRHFRVDLGAYGNIDMRFRPERVFVDRDHCHATFRSGHFVGTATYAGEAGATGVSTTRARGQMLTSRDCSVHIALRAEPPPAPRARAPLARTLVAFTRRSAGLPLTLFEALRIGRDGPPYFLAIQFTREAGVRVQRTAITQSPSNVFTSNRALTRASVSGPAPFAGSAAYSAENAVPWDGDLTAELLGGHVVALAGPQFRAELVTGTPDKLGRLAP